MIEILQYVHNYIPSKTVDRELIWGHNEVHYAMSFMQYVLVRNMPRYKAFIVFNENRT